MANDYAGNAAFLRSLADGLTPDPLMTVAEWADSYRMLSGRAAAEAGKYRTSRTPYMREIMENQPRATCTDRGHHEFGECPYHHDGQWLCLWPIARTGRSASLHGCLDAVHGLHQERRRALWQ